MTNPNSEFLSQGLAPEAAVVQARLEEAGALPYQDPFAHDPFADEPSPLPDGTPTTGERCVGKSFTDHETWNRYVVLAADHDCEGGEWLVVRGVHTRELIDIWIGDPLVDLLLAERPTMDSLGYIVVPANWRGGIDTALALVAVRSR